MSPLAPPSAASGRRYHRSVSTLLDRLAAFELAALRTAGDRGAPAAPLRRQFRTHIDRVVAALLMPHLRREIVLWRHARSMGGWVLTTGPEPAPEDDGTALDHMDTGGWEALFERLPLLRELVTTVVGGEVAAAQRFLADLRQDLPALSASFFAGVGVEAVAVQPGLSDPHAGRRTVCAVRFGNGRTLIYKPRPVGMERGLGDLLAWLAGRKAPLVVQAPPVCDCGDHGWMAHVPFTPCAAADDVELYFQRLGAFACLLACLGAVDCHADNFIARGAAPVLVDAETLLHPRLAASPGFTLMETEIFPRSLVTPRGQTIVYGGFDKEYAALGEAVEAAARSSGRRNLPHFGGEAMTLAAHRAATETGMAAMADWLDRHAAALLAGDGPVAELAGNAPRVILRPTSLYAAVLVDSWKETALGDAATRAAGIARLRRYDDPTLSPIAWDAIHRAEREALVAADIPSFRLDPASGDLLAGSRVVAPAAFAPVRDRLARGFTETLRACRDGTAGAAG